MPSIKQIYQNPSIMLCTWDLVNEHKHILSLRNCTFYVQKLGSVQLSVFVREKGNNTGKSNITKYA